MTRDHRALSIQFLRSTKLIPVKVRPGGKEPFPEWDPRRADQEDHSATLRQLEDDTSLNLGALMAGRYVDIDIDCTSVALIEALEYFLPKTPWVFGRKSKPRSHRLYVLEEDFDRAPWSNTLRYLKGLKEGVIDGDSYSVEVRGGKPENGLYTALPGNWREDVKEHIEWADDMDPTVAPSMVKIEDLLKSIRLATAAAAIVPHWVSGVRNDMSLALAGMLWRIRTSTLAAFGLEPTDPTPDGQYVLDEADAKAIIACVCKLAGDDPEDRRSRILNMQNTWRKLDQEASAKVTGGKVLANLIDGGEVDGPSTGKRVIKAMYRLLSDNDAAESIERLTEQFVMWYGPGVILDIEAVRQGRVIPWMTKEQARNSLGGKKIVIGDNRIPMVDMLFGSTIIHRVMGLTFDPAHDELLTDTPEGLMVNQWKGFSVKPSGQRVKAEEIAPFREYVMEVLASGNEELAHWIFSWCADMFQYPADKPGTALVLVGVQGAGKTFLGERVLGEIIGPSHYLQVNNVSRLTDKFNTSIDNRVFVQCDEAVHSYQKDVASRLKSVITDATITIEPKGVNAYTKPNHMRLLFTSNEETAALFIDASPHERRFTVVKVNSSRASDLEWWSNLREWTAANLPKIHQWLLDYKYDRRLVSRPYKTAAKEDLQRVSMDPEVSWIISRMASGFLLGNRAHRNWFEAFNSQHITDNDKKNNNLRRDHWPDRVMLAALEEDYKNFIREHGRPVYSGSVMTNIRRVFPEDGLKSKQQITVRITDPKTNQLRIDRVRVSAVPTVEEMMAHLTLKYGGIVSKVFEEIKASGEDADEAVVLNTEF